MRGVIAACLSLSLSAAATGADLTLAWDPVSGSNVGGYIVEWGLGSGNYTWSLDVANTSEITLTGLTKGTKYYFAVRTYDTSGLQSGYSNEVGIVVGLTETTTSQDVYRTGDMLSIGSIGDNPGIPTIADLYFCIVLPNGDNTICITNLQTMSYINASLSDLSSLRPVMSGFSLASPRTWDYEMVRYYFKGTDLPGTYMAFMRIVTSGALGDGVLTSTESLGYGAKEFTFNP